MQSPMFGASFRCDSIKSGYQTDDAGGGGLECIQPAVQKWMDHGITEALARNCGMVPPWLIQGRMIFDDRLIHPRREDT